VIISQYSIKQIVFLTQMKCPWQLLNKTLVLKLQRTKE